MPPAAAQSHHAPAICDLKPIQADKRPAYARIGPQTHIPGTRSCDSVRNRKPRAHSQGGRSRCVIGGRCATRLCCATRVVLGTPVYETALIETGKSWCVSINPMMAPLDEQFHRALLAWRAEPFDGDTVDEHLVRIVRPNPQSAVELARGHLTAVQVDVQAVAYELLAVAAELGDQQVRTDVASLVLEAYEDESERDPDVLVGVVRALGSAQDPRGLPVLTALAAHPDAGVRFRVAADLPMIMGDPPEPDGVTALIALTADPDPQIRDWATFGLGSQADADSEAVRQALWARTGDAYADARDEAVVALARRRDAGVRPLVADLLSQPSVGTLIFEAAAHLKDPALLPLLRRFDVADDDVRAAIEACYPGGSAGSGVAIS